MQEVRRRLWTSSILAIFAMGVVLLALYQRAPAEAAQVVEDATCLDCHEGLDRTLAMTPHRLASQITGPVTAVTCAGCHGGASAHIEDPSRETVTTPAELSGHDAVTVCSACHVTHVGLDNYGFDAHSIQEMNCAACHKIHGSEPGLLLSDNARFCIACHGDKVTGLMLSSNHPVFQDAVTCLSCHRFAKRADDNLAYERQGVCGACHPEQAGPFQYEHDAVNAYAVEGGGCTECHRPHGSDNDRLLKQPGPQLCRQCHGVPPGHVRNTAHGNAWARYDCVACHTQVHGSFDNALFLDPELPARWGVNCFGANCHSLNR